MKKQKHLYRASSSDMDTFDMETNNKEKVAKRIKSFGFDIKDWRIDRIY